MALNFADSTGNLFNRLGQIFSAIRDANLYLAAGDLSSGGLQAVGVRTGNIDAQFASADQELVSGGALVGGQSLYASRDAVRSALQSWKAYLVSLAQAVLIEMVDDDTVLPARTVQEALIELIRQMADNDLSGNGTVHSPDDDVDANTVSATATAVGANTGNGTVVVSVKRRDNRDNEHVLAETLILRCTDDAGTGGTAGQEPFEVLGETPASSELGWDWPLGSGASARVQSVDPTLDAQSQGNLLTNSDFEDFTANVPDNWALLAGAAGTEVFKNISVFDDGAASLEFRETASDLLSAVAQTFDSDTGTTGTLEPSTLYAVAFRARKSDTMTAGILEVSLVDASNNYIDDDAGNDIATTVAHGTLTTAFAWYTATFVTPKVLPATYKLRVRVQTAIDSSGGSEAFYVDRLALAAMDEAYTGGPWLKVISGTTAWVKNDRVNVAVANNGAGLMQQYFQRVFNMRGLDLQLPSDASGTETVVDTLLTP